MKRSATILLFIIAVWRLCVFSTQRPAPANDAFRPKLLQNMDSIVSELRAITLLSDKTELLKHYHNARKYYKEIEFWVEYTSPLDAKFYINGPLVPKYDFEMGQKTYQPNGFQRIEELLFTDEAIDTVELHKTAEELRARIFYMRDYYRMLRQGDEYLLEMIQLQLYRIASMNISGYDCTISLENIPETVWAVEGLQQAFETFRGYCKDNDEAKKQYNILQKQLEQAKRYLEKHPDYNTFDRLYFITTYITELNKTMVKFHYATKLPWTYHKKALNLYESFPFGKESFNMRYFSLYYNDTVNQDLQIALGKKMFYDSILSNTGNKACVSCHQPEKAFTDGFPLGVGQGGKPLSRNVPSLTNVAMQKLFFYDGRALNMEQQAFDVVHNEEEMQGDLDAAANRLRKDSVYVRLFAEAFKNTFNADIAPYGILKALTEYEKTLLSFDSRFDKYLRGDKTALTAREINGYNVFAGKALCGSCHFFPIFNGTVPPTFRDTEFEVLGVPKTAENKALDDDIGREKTTKFPDHNRSFKTPTLRNIELTAPYMHNGCYNTLEEVVDFYVKGGGAGLGFNVPNQTLPFDSLSLTKTEQEDLVLFMKTLTDIGAY